MAKQIYGATFSFGTIERNHILEFPEEQKIPLLDKLIALIIIAFVFVLIMAITIVLIKLTAGLSAILIEQGFVFGAFVAAMIMGIFITGAMEFGPDILSGEWKKWDLNSDFFWKRVLPVLIIGSLIGLSIYGQAAQSVGLTSKAIQAASKTGEVSGKTWRPLARIMPYAESTSFKIQLGTKTQYLLRTARYLADFQDMIGILTIKGLASQVYMNDNLGGDPLIGGAILGLGIPGRTSLLKIAGRMIVGAAALNYMGERASIRKNNDDLSVWVYKDQHGRLHWDYFDFARYSALTINNWPIHNPVIKSIVGYAGLTVDADYLAARLLMASAIELGIAEEEGSFDWRDEYSRTIHYNQWEAILAEYALNQKEWETGIKDHGMF
jgi:hypothetical protein